MGIGVVYAKGHLDEMIPYQSRGDMIDQVSFSGTPMRKDLSVLRQVRPMSAVQLV